MAEPIPSPPGLPMVGNMYDINAEDTQVSLMHLADVYGPIFKLRLGGNDRFFVSSFELLNEICDEKRFEKTLAGPLLQVRNGLGNGMFTAYGWEHNWQIAHRVLVPAFGPLKIQDMFDEMHDIASQLVLKWARDGAEAKINVPEDFTRLTLDSIALCAMDTRFNSFYKDELHPFAHAMVGFLQESGRRARRPAALNLFMRRSQQEYDANIAYMHKVASEIATERRTHPVDKKDLLNAMINGRDPKTGEHLSEENITNNMISFLIAGHDTTSGLLSFLFYFLLKDPDKLIKARQEVDSVIGSGPVKVEHLGKIPYITACLRETLRLEPSAPGISLSPVSKGGPTVVCGGKYQFEPNSVITVILGKAHRDPMVFGEDADSFRPERMIDENFQKLPKNCWKPFGNGVRSCVGRPFAWQEALLMTCLLLQKFDFRLDDPSYQLTLLQALTIKPKGFFMHASLREGIDVVQLEKKMYSGGPSAVKKRSVNDAAAKASEGKPMTVLYGSNTGTCEALAQSLAASAASRGFAARVATVDEKAKKLPTGEPVVIVTCSYEGEPPDNAVHFMEWLGRPEAKSLSDVHYAVFGCGHRDWQATFHKIPKLTDTLLEQKGAKRIAPHGLTDVAAGDVFNVFDEWSDKTLWPAIVNSFGGHDPGAEDQSQSLDVEILTNPRSTHLRVDVSDALVLRNDILTAAGQPEKRHIHVRLPTEMSYEAGDYLSVLPVNNGATIKRVAKRFGLPWDAMMLIKSGSNTTLPVGEKITVIDVLGAYVELNQPATAKNVAAILKSIPDGAELADAGKLTINFDQELSAHRLSVLDLLERFPTATLPFADFLAMLPPMRPRQYSISSSPLADPSVCTITVSVLDQESQAGNGTRFLGVTTTYLAGVSGGDQIRVSVKHSRQGFHLPLDVGLPIIMVCAGTGIAPFRGFVQERAIQIAAGRKLGPALLFFGCKSPNLDALHSEELRKWEKLGAVELKFAFSRAKELSEGCVHVQDRLWQERGRVAELFGQGAKIYVCGSSGVGEAVKVMTRNIYIDAAAAKEEVVSEADAKKWFEEVKRERYYSDVFT